MQATNQKNSSSPLSQSLSRRSTADQKVRGIWVRDCDVGAITNGTIGDQIISFNSLINVNNRPVFYKNWLSHGVCENSHLLKENGAFLSFNEMRKKILALKWLEFYGVVSAIKSL